MELYKIIFTLTGNGYDGLDFETEYIRAYNMKHAKALLINRYKHIGAKIEILFVERTR